MEDLYRRLLHKDLPDHEQELVQGLSKEGCPLLGEALAFNIYPFFFAEWVVELVRKVKSPGAGEQIGRTDYHMPKTRSA